MILVWLAERAMYRSSARVGKLAWPDIEKAPARW